MTPVTGAPPLFAPLDMCWVCGSNRLAPYHTLRFEHDAFLNGNQDPELAGYTGQTLTLVRCAACGFGQPSALPTLPAYFDRMYDQRWDPEWVAREFDAQYKDAIFHAILRELSSRLPASRRTLLDVGAHAGRFLHLAQQAGWIVEGIELNPRTAAYAARRTGATVHQAIAQTLADQGRRYDAVVLTDVLEHIPDPVRTLSTLFALIKPGGSIAVKVPCGPSQALKERVLAGLTAHRATLADNLVHVSHFSPKSVTLALERAGFTRVRVRTGVPEYQPYGHTCLRPMLSNAVRLAVYAVGRLPGGVDTPLALHLQTFASSPS